jgi:hypothetical protein
MRFVGLFSRSDGTQVTVTPAVVSPRQTAHAIIATDKPITKVSTATVEWGYSNFYRYRWAGRADSAAAAVNDSIWTMDQVGTNYGSEKDTDDWVAVTRAELPLPAGEFTGGSSTFTVPSWAPGSSPMLARWSCRLTVKRGGRDVDTRGDFAVVIRPTDLAVEDAPTEHVDGSNDVGVDIALSSPIYRPGDSIKGQITLRPHLDLPNGNAAVYWQLVRESHPLARSPAAATAMDGRILQLDKKIPLRANTPVVLPFALQLPGDAAPTGTAVHSSLSWFVAVRMFYAGFTSHLTERARRPIVVVNGP